MKQAQEHISAPLLAIICDIDGTLAHKGDRSPYDWSRVGEDSVDETIKILLQRFYEHHILLVSGRDEVCRTNTELWLEANDIEYDALFMRPEGNNEDDRIIKRRIYEEEIKDKYEVLLVLDDRPKVIRMWRELGLKVLDCGDGVEF